MRVFLDSLAAQTHRDFELLVIDQNPDGRLTPVLDRYEGSFPIVRLRSEKGLSRARNAGLPYAGGDILAFPDDDCAYPPDTLARVNEFFTRNARAAGLTGRSVDEAGDTTSGNFATEAGPVDRFNVWGRGISFTIFVRADSVAGLRFDERLGAGAGTVWGSGEETDYLLRLIHSGGRVHYDPALTVVHPAAFPPYDGKARRKAYEYGRGMGHLLRRHRYPARVRMMRLARPLGGALLSVLRLKVGKAGYHMSIFRGRLRGMIT